MKMPPLAVMTALGLENPCQRLFWALTQLFGAMAPSPIVAANVANNMPASAANTGLNPVFLKNHVQFPTRSGGFAELKHGYNFNLKLPVNTSLLAAGCDVRQAIGELVVGNPEPLIASAKGSNPVAETSTAQTVEEYAYEQWLLVATDLSTAGEISIPAEGSTTYSLQPHALSQWFFAEDASQDIDNATGAGTFFPQLILKGTLLKKKTIAATSPASESGSSGSCIYTPFKPSNISTFAGWASS